MTTGLGLQPEITSRLVQESIPVIVTGAGGWLGQTALAMLDDALGENFEAQITAYTNLARNIKLRSGRVVNTHDYNTLAAAKAPGAVILHFAYLTRGYASAMPRDDYITANTTISDIMAAHINRNGVRGLFAPSSGAVYGPDRALIQDLDANPYGVLKLRDENRFQNLAQQAGIPLCMMRIFNLAGPYINHVEHYALASIIGDVLRGGPIKLRASQKIYRSFSFTGDIINLAFSSLLQGKTQPVFDTAGEEVLEIGTLAARIARLAGQPGMAIERPDLTHGPADYYAGDGEIYFANARALGVALTALDAQITATMAYLKT